MGPLPTCMQHQANLGVQNEETQKLFRKELATSMAEAALVCLPRPPPKQSRQKPKSEVSPYWSIFKAQSNIGKMEMRSEGHREDSPTS